MLHTFTKYSSGAWVNQIGNKDLNDESSCLTNLSEMNNAGNHQ